MEWYKARDNWEQRCSSKYPYSLEIENFEPSDDVTYIDGVLRSKRQREPQEQPNRSVMQVDTVFMQLDDDEDRHLPR